MYSLHNPKWPTGMILFASMGLELMFFPDVFPTPSPMTDFNIWDYLRQSPQEMDLGVGQVIGCP